MPDCHRCRLYPMYPREWCAGRKKWVHPLLQGTPLCQDQTGPAVYAPWMSVRDAYEATWVPVGHPKGGTHWVLQDSHVIEMACREVLKLRGEVERLRKALGGSDV